MEEKQNVMIIAGHGWAVCGRVARITSPFQFTLENCSVICRTGGTPWDALADGEGRDGATFRKWGTVTLATGFVLSREWKGELP